MSAAQTLLSTKINGSAEVIQKRISFTVEKNVRALELRIFEQATSRAGKTRSLHGREMKSEHCVTQSTCICSIITFAEKRILYKSWTVRKCTFCNIYCWGMQYEPSWKLRSEKPYKQAGSLLCINIIADL